jgi:hypothetical protein
VIVELRSRVHLFEAGSTGLLSNDIACRLRRFKIIRHQISRRILKMNRRLAKESGKQVAEQSGWHWALTGFALDAYGAADVSDVTAAAAEGYSLMERV